MDKNKKEINECKYQIAVLQDKIRKTVDEVQRGLWSDEITKLKDKIKKLERTKTTQKISQVSDASPIADKVPVPANEPIKDALREDGVYKVTI